MTQVNLLPSDVRERQRSRRLVAAVVAAVGAVVALLFFVFVLQSARLSNAEQRLQAQQAVNADLQSKIGQLEPFQQLKQTVAAREAVNAGALNGQVAWSGILRDVSVVIPNQMWLTAMTGSLTDVSSLPIAPGGATTSTPTESLTPFMAGTIQFQGVASDFPTVARWLSRLEQVKGWVNAWASSAVKSSTDDTSDPNANKVQFNVSVDLGSEATVQGAKQ
ncbi:MAG: PilN domain-containing protein [Actinomycetota bacterium]